MRRGRILTVLACVVLLGGCAGAPTQGQLAAGPARDGRAAARALAVECTTTWVVLATVSKCGSGGFRFGVAAE